MLNWLRWHWNLIVLFFAVCKHRELLLQVFDSLEEDDGRRYHLELRTLKRKVAKAQKNKSLTKPMLLRNEFFNMLNSQQEEFFIENLEILIAMLSAWFINRKIEPKTFVEEEVENSKDPETDDVE